MHDRLKSIAARLAGESDERTARIIASAVKELPEAGTVCNSADAILADCARIAELQAEISRIEESALAAADALLSNALRDWTEDEIADALLAQACN